MSIFYLTPVKGDLPLFLLETIVIKRLEFLKAVYKKLEIVYNEYVVEGSVYDTVGHYMLCITVIFENNSELTQFFFKSEEILFRQRLKTLSAYDLRSLAKKLLHIIKRHQSSEFIVDPLSSLCQHLKIKHIAQHVNSDECCENCSLHSLKVYFKYCLSFVANRQVEIKEGFAHIPCFRWKTYLTVLFVTNLRNKIKKTNLESLKDDPRISDIIGKVRKTFEYDNNYNITHLRSSEVDNAASLFPPCMKNLHQHLRLKHRLSHNQRFSYSLFLKDIGMPVEEAITFWRNEYAHVPYGKHKCCHNWKDDEKKFVYGIRHLYGLEGGRKSYTSGNCKRIINSDTSCSEGGCPFKSFDDEAMLQILDIKNEIILSQIKNLKTQKQYTSACMIYLQKKFSFILNDNCNSNSFSPVKFYLFASKCKIL